MKIQYILFALAISFFLCGCPRKPTSLDDPNFNTQTRTGDGSIIIDGGDYSDGQDFRTYTDLMRTFRRASLPFTGCGKLLAEPAQAESAYRFRIGDRFIGVYYYNYSNRVQRAKLESIKESGILYVIGVPYRVYVNGCYVFTDIADHEYREEILNALKHF